MGVDVWRERQSGVGGPAESEVEAHHIAGPADAALTTALAEPERAVAEAEVAEAEVAEAEVKAEVESIETPVRPPPIQSLEGGGATSIATEPFAVLCLSREGAVLLSQPSDLRAARRFGADLLAAVTGVWGGQSDQLIFEWPQPGIDASAESMSKALGAFVIKQVGDNADGLTLVGAEVVERLGRVPVPDECMVIPAIDELMTSGDLKRTQSS
jgi:hypothetical protein